MTEKLFSKNFILLVLGQVSSLFGNYIIKFALSMYVLDTTGSATIFASILSIAAIPTLYSGVLCFFITATPLYNFFQKRITYRITFVL